MVDLNLELESDRAHATAAGDRGTPVDLQRLGALIWRARYVLAAVAVLGGALGIYVAKTWIPVRYSATAALVWEPKDSTDDPAEHERKLRTIVESVKLPRNLELVRQRRKAPMSLEQLAHTIDVAVRPDSSMIQVSGEAESPRDAKALADEVAKVLVDRQTETYIAELQESEERMSALLSISRDEAARARKAYDAFRAEHGIIYLPSDRDQLVEQVRTYASAAHLADVDADAHRTRASTLTVATARLRDPVVLSERELDAGKKQQAELAAEVEALRGSLSDDHPKVLALRAQLEQIAAADASLAPVVDSRVVGRHPQLDTVEQGATVADADRAAASARHERLRDLEADANARLERLNGLEGLARELFATVARTEERVSHFEQALTLIRDELSAPNVGLSILSEASMPTYPSSSKRRVVALAIPIAALTLALVLVLALSNRGLRAHSAREVAYWARLPVMASTRWPSSSSEHDRPAEQLAAMIAERDSVLLLPLTPELGSHADELAAMLRDELVAVSDDRDSRNETGIEVERSTDVALLRKRVRSSERVIVLARSGHHTVLELRALRGVLGRHEGAAIVLIGVGPHLATLPDRAGDVATFIATAGA